MTTELLGTSENSLIDALRKFIPVIEDMEKEGFIASYLIHEGEKAGSQGLYPRITFLFSNSENVYMYPEERIKGKLMVKVYSEVKGPKSPASQSVLKIMDIVDEYQNLDKNLIVRRGGLVYDPKNDLTRITFEIQDLNNLF